VVSPDERPPAATAGDLADDPAAGDADGAAVDDTAGVEPAGPGGARPAVAGRRIILANRWATVVFVVVSIAAAIVPDPLERVSVPVDLVLFAVGCATFLWGYALAIGRSQYEVVSLGGVFFLAGDVAPRAVALELRVALAVQVVVAVAVASARPFTALAFSVLVPMLGLGMMALWGGRHGSFPSRDTDERPEVAQ
jgi:hypothetical protein